MVLRILHVVTYMGRGGLETMLMNYYRHIDRTRVQFDFLVHRDFVADYDNEILSMGGKVFRLPQLNPFSYEYLQKLNEFFSTHTEYKIVHSHLDCMAGLPLKYAKKYGVPIRIAHAHNSNQSKDKKYFLKLLYKRKIHKHANHLYACGKDAGIWMFNTDEFTILNNAIDSMKYVYCSAKQRAMRKQLGISEDSLVIGHVGRFSHQKNHEFLIKLFYELQLKEATAVLLLVGDGELKEEIEKQSVQLGIRDKIIFTGVRSDVEDLLQAMDIFIFPSLYEGLPVSIIEAQASGLPCIISDNVPIDCKLTNEVYQVGLSEDLNEWVKIVQQCIKHERQNNYIKICSAGFDIKENAKILENTYLHFLRERE